MNKATTELQDWLRRYNDLVEEGRKLAPDIVVPLMRADYRRDLAEAEKKISAVRRGAASGRASQLEERHADIADERGLLSQAVGIHLKKHSKHGSPTIARALLKNPPHPRLQEMFRRRYGWNRDEDPSTNAVYSLARLIRRWGLMKS